MLGRMQTWAIGDYGRVAQLIAGQGRDLVAAAGVRPGQRVLDVACGSGNATIPAARAGAAVTALDVTPQLLAAGRRAAGDLPVEWVEGDASDLPFEDSTFDIVLSCIGAMFAPDHLATARELTRVCRPGGLVALANWMPDGGAGRFFEVLARHGPAPAPGPPPSNPPPSSPPPTRWGEPAYVRKLFDGLPVETAERAVELDFDGTPAELAELYLSSFPPVVATRAALDGEAARAALDRDLLAFFTAESAGVAGRWRYEWLLVRVALPPA
jgi:SAM-dependent methyltransferase